MTSSEKRMLLPILRKLANHEKLNHRAQSAAEQLYARLTRPSLKSKSGRLRRKSEKQSARASHNQETGAIYRAVRDRAGGRCECGCGVVFSEHPGHWPELDHFHGRAKGQSVETCWMLIAVQHQDKTLNRPDREYWNVLFAAHCAKYGYEFIPRLVKPAKAGGAP